MQANNKGANMSSKQKITPELEKEFNRLMQKSPDGLLRPEAVVNAAESLTSPLHNFFTWDTEIAAEKWLLHEASMLIRSYTIFVEELKVEVRAFTSLEVDRENGGGYRWTTEVVRRPDLRSQLIDTALNELNRIRQKYSHLKELADIWDSIDSKN